MQQLLGLEEIMCVYLRVCVCIAVCMLSLCLQIIVSLTYALEWQLGK